MTKAMEMIISGLVSKVDNNCVDFFWKKIKTADENRKSFEQNIETRIYQVIVDSINTFTFNAYKDQDTLYYAAECILRGFINKIEYIEAVKMGLKMLESQITVDRCVDFLGILCNEICKDKNDILYKRICIIQNEHIIETVYEGFNKSKQYQDDIRECIHEYIEKNKQNYQESQKKLDFLVEEAGNKQAYRNNKIYVKNRAEEYADKWDKNVFLNDFKKRDKNAGVSVKLKDIYLEAHLPHYTWKMDNEPLNDLKELLREYTINNDSKNMLIILGQPGIGKSTLITWMMVNLKEMKDDFLVYQFASDLNGINWQEDHVLKKIFTTLNMKFDELENKVLILDGYDEIDVKSDRERILNKIDLELAEMNILKNFSLIITCRENYVYDLKNIGCDYIVLQSWDKKQIKSFCDIYGKESKCSISETKVNKLTIKKEVFGIPLILYMTLALNISIEKNTSIVDIYDHIFSLDRSGIYERCIKNSRYGGEHRISKVKIKQQIHQISQRIAFWIFEKNSEKASIPRLNYEKICDAVNNDLSEGNETIKRDLLIGNYFKITKHYRGIGTDELCFIHRSIYEYFVVVYFFESLKDITSKKDAANKLAQLLKELPV